MVHNLSDYYIVVTLAFRPLRPNPASTNFHEDKRGLTTHPEGALLSRVVGILCRTTVHTGKIRTNYAELWLTSLCCTSPMAAGSDTALATLAGGARVPAAAPPPTTGGWYPPCGAAGGGGE